MAIHTELVPCRTDNYALLLHDDATGTTVLVDAPEEAPLRDALARRQWRLTHILITHHHADHVEALLPLKQAFGIQAYGPDRDMGRITGLDKGLRDGDRLQAGSFAVEVMETPGHTLGHIAFHFPNAAILCAGDTLFALGCGRLFEGTPEMMWMSLQRLRALPPHTSLYCGHEYTLANARFALSVNPGNTALAAYAARVEALRMANRPTLPSTIRAECDANPFLRADDPSLAAALGMEGADALAVFTELRARKDRF